MRAMQAGHGEGVLEAEVAPAGVSAQLRQVARYEDAFDPLDQCLEFDVVLGRVERSRNGGYCHSSPSSSPRRLRQPLRRNFSFEIHPRVVTQGCW